MGPVSRRLRLQAGTVVAVFALAIAPAAVEAQSSDRTGSPSLRTRWSAKATGVVSEPGHRALWRLRIEPSVRLGPGVSFELAYEHAVRAEWARSPAGSGLTVLPPDLPPAFRLSSLDWTIARGDHAAWRHEIDRAVLHAQLPRVDLSIGRQAVGWGRGVLFGAVDLFAPFSPFEADREWRRGADAIRVGVPVSDRASADAVLVFGRRRADWTYAGRVRGYAGTVDVEGVGGRRAGDTFGGVTTSFVIGQAEVHAEVALFRTPAEEASGAFAVPRTIPKIVVGGSSWLGIGNGLAVYVEYHYSGFGARSAAETATLLIDQTFVARVARGDTQILTRHAVAVLGAYEWSPLASGSVALVQEPTDGSGVLMPSLTLTFGDTWSVLSTAYFSFGRETTAASASAYGSVPATGLVQLRIYR